MSLFIYNTDLKKELIDGAGVQSGSNLNRIPKEIAEKVLPVMEVNPKLLRRCEIVRFANALNTASTTIYTTPTNQDFYLVGATLTYTKDNLNGATSVRMIIQVQSLSTRIIDFAVLATTAQSDSMSISFPFPIKLDRNSTIVMGTSSVAAGNIQIGATIAGYVV